MTTINRSWHVGESFLYINKYSDLAQQKTKIMATFSLMIYSPENQHDMTFGNFAIFNRKYIFTHGGFSSNAMFISMCGPRVVGEMPMQNVKLIARHLQKHWFDHLAIHFFAEDVLDIVFFVAGCDWFVCLFVCWFVCLLVCFLVCLDNWLVWSGFVWLTICGDPTKEVHGRVFCWNPSTSCWVKKRAIINPTIPLVQSVEEIRHQLIGSVSQYLQGFIHPRWCRISSTKSIIK